MFKLLVTLISKAVLIAVLIFPCHAIYASQSYSATTNKNLNVEAEDLEHMVLPLTKQELELEALAWMQSLKAIVKKMSRLEIKIKRLDRKAELVERAADNVENIAEAYQTGDEEAVAEEKSELKVIAEELDMAKGKIKKLSSAASDELAEKVSDKAEQYESRKNTLAKKVASLRLEHARVNKLFNIVLNQLQQKGGDITEMQAYSDAVSGLNVNIGDSSTAWLAVMAWLKSENGGILLLINLIKFIIALSIVYFLSKVTGKIADRITRSNSVSLLLEDFIKVAARRTVLIIGFIMSLPIIGINVGPVLALIGAAGLVVGLALQGTLSNFASGVLILIYRPYDMNDVIQVGGVTGIVNSMTLLCTTIKTLDNQLITVPNNNVWNDTITNITGSSERRIDLMFGIAYSDDFTKAKNIMLDILANHPKVLKDPESVVRVHELGDSSVNFVCRPWVKTDDYWDVHWDIIEAVKREFDAQGVSIPFPQRDVHLISDS